MSEEKKDSDLLPEKSASDLLAMDDRPFFPVQVLKWGCTIWCREPDGVTTGLICSSTRSPDGTVNNADRNAKFVIEGAYESDGQGGYRKKFSPAHAEALKLKGDSVAFLANEIANGKKNEPLKS